MFEDKKLLILANLFPSKDSSFHIGSFVKGQVDELRKYFEEITVISPQPMGYQRNLKDYSYENVKVYYPRFLHAPVSFFRMRLGDNFFKATLKVIKRERPEFDLIHAHFTWPSGYAAVKLGKEFSVPVVITAHGYDVYDLPFRGEKWFKLVKSVLESSDHIITVSKSNFEILTQKLHIPEKKISLIPNGFNSELFRPMSQKEARKTLGIPFDRKILLNVANLVPVKGQRFLIEAMKEVVESRKDVLLLIVGGGPLIKDLKEQIFRAKLENYVKIVGPKPHDEIPLWMNAADLFVLPSLSEGNPTVMFEALGVGLPFVGTKVGGVPEIIISEDYGLLCEPANPKDLAEKILIALEKEWDREKIRKYAEQFTWENIATRILEVYKRHTLYESFHNNT